MRSDTRGWRGRGEQGEAQPRVRTVAPRRPLFTRTSVTSSLALVSGGNGASRRCPIIMQVRVESRRKSFGSSSPDSQEQGRNSGVVHTVSGRQRADPKENHIFTLQLQHNHLRLRSAQRSRRSCSFDMFASLLRPGSQLEFPPCRAVQLGSAMCAIISDLINKCF